jgi:ABC-type arginine transport system ATPase subunit
MERDMNLTNGEAEIALTILFNKQTIPCKIPVAAIRGKVVDVKSDGSHTIITLNHPVKVLDSYSNFSSLTVQENIDDVSARCAKALEEEKTRNLELLKKYRLSPVG